MPDFAATGSRSFAFGPFVLIPERQVLLASGSAVRLGGRALDILTVLVTRAGELVSKRELLAHVWPNTVVEESNLKVNIAALRRALGDGADTVRYIATVTGRGYRFVAPVQAAISPEVFTTSLAAEKRSHNLPRWSTRIIGRDGVIDAIRREFEESRLVSIVGAGGIGKTTVALAVAEHAVASFKDGVWLIDLSLSTNPDLVAHAVAMAIGLPTSCADVLAALSDYLGGREMLLVLDSCEHVIDAAACCADQILARAPGVKILATSREPLRIATERVRRLPGLAAPPCAPNLSAEEAMMFPAVQLFVERATSSFEQFELNDNNAQATAEICRRLDGLPLAIDFAASRTSVFGVGGVLKMLDDRFRLLVGRRAGPERQRTLTATLDWSYSLLPAGEAAVLRAVSVFDDAFDAEGAAAVAGVAAADAVEALIELAAKSLLTADLDLDVEGTVYRIPETTRSHCLERLAVSGEAQDVMRRLAEHAPAVLSSIGRCSQVL